jgi:hypothetical protein
MIGARSRTYSCNLLGSVMLRYSSRNILRHGDCSSDADGDNANKCFHTYPRKPWGSCRKQERENIHHNHNSGAVSCRWAGPAPATVRQGIPLCRQSLANLCDLQALPAELSHANANPRSRDRRKRGPCFFTSCARRIRRSQ